MILGPQPSWMVRLAGVGVRHGGPNCLGPVVGLIGGSGEFVGHSGDDVTSEGGSPGQVP